MMHIIRPWKIFNAIPEQNAWERRLNGTFPLRRDPMFPDYSLRLLDLYCLLAMMRLVDTRIVFEFGTFLGNTTLHLASNLPKYSMVWTFDLDEETSKKQTGVWAPLVALRSRFPMEFAGTPAQDKIKCLTGDSRTYDFSRFENFFDLVFCDGDREYPMAASDTNWAMRILRKDKPACILWHDYCNPEARDHTRFLDNLAENGRELVHVDETMLCIYCNDEKITKRILNGTAG